MQAHPLNISEPWQNVPAARSFLNWLVVDAKESEDAPPVLCRQADAQAVAAWLVRQGLGALAYDRCQGTGSKLNDLLQADMFSAAAEASLKLAALAGIREAFAAAGIRFVLLKGAALGLTVYRDPALRTMSDIDLWLPAAGRPAAAALMQTLGYRFKEEKTERPLALHELASGEIQFFHPDWRGGYVELHATPFEGWWLARTAVVDEAPVWSRTEAVAGWEGVGQMAAEDMVIHLAVHTAINHQFGLSALRSLLDIALTAGKRGVNWPVVAERAKEWRVATAVYTVLDLLDQLIGVTGLEPALNALRPPAWRMKLIRRFVTPESVLAGRDLRNGRQRFLLLLLLVDRPQDAAKLAGRALWPEQAWLDARYGGGVSHWRHLWRVVRYGNI